ncbi:putative aldehyde reductase 2 [Xylariomycetidae sp. FL2044]|nr:putative aldehyde reductase 2 [Xylariomycetidae sp. FL2044]
MVKITNPALPLDSVVVVIGANGYIGAETCEKLLLAGYRVRGTVRDVEKNRWMLDYFGAKWPGKFSLACVEDFEADGAFDDAFSGAAGVIYVSTPVIFDADPARVIEPIVRGTLNTLEAAARAGSVQRYVLSSSSKAVEETVVNRPHVLTTETFNYEALRRAREEPPPPSSGVAGDTFARRWTVYCASRTAAELAFWEWVRAHRREAPFVANVVVADGNFGRAIQRDGGEKTSTGMLRRALAGESEGVLKDVGYLVDVQDMARLLVAALALPSLVEERIFAYYRHYTWNELRQRVRELYPDRHDIVTGEDLDITGRDEGDASALTARAEALLQEVGQPGFTSVDTMLRDFVESFYP